MNWKKYLLLSGILTAAFISGSALIWHGLNLDKQSITENYPQEESQVLGDNSQAGSTSSESVAENSENIFHVEKVVDGDTFHIKLNGQTVSVRLIGIDTPETVDPRRPVGCFGKNASNETKRLIEGKDVLLLKDVSETDKYKRLLRYVYLPLGDGENLFINDYLVRQGFATTLTYPPDIKYDQRFKEAEREARESLRGLWGECK